MYLNFTDGKVFTISVILGVFFGLQYNSYVFKYYYLDDTEVSFIFTWWSYLTQNIWDYIPQTQKKLNNHTH